jgi:hypothetical protein
MVVLLVAMTSAYQRGAPNWAMAAMVAILVGLGLMAKAAFAQENYRATSLFRLGNVGLLGGLLVVIVWAVTSRR